MGIRKPAADWHSVLGVEDVGCRRVVDNDSVLEVASDLGQILDVVSLVIVAALSEKSVVHDLVDVKLIKERVTVLDHPVSWLHDTNGAVEESHTLETDAVKTTTS